MASVGRELADAQQSAFSALVVDQGMKDQFLAGQLLPESLQAAAAVSGQELTLRRHDEHDHSYCSFRASSTIICNIMRSASTGSPSIVNEQLDDIIARHRGKPGPLLLVLHAIQDELGYIPAEAVPLIADGLNLSRAEVHGVVTFYHYFRRRRRASASCNLCRAEAVPVDARRATGRRTHSNVWHWVSRDHRGRPDFRWSRCTAWAIARVRRR